MDKLIFATLIFVGTASFLHFRLLQYLRYYQQEEYNSRRFLRWIFDQSAFDRKGSLTILIAIAVSFFSGYTLVPALITTAALIAMGLSEENPRKEGKIRLKMTERATRIYRYGFALSLCITLIAILALYLYDFIPPASWIAQIALIQLTPFWLMLGNSLLQRDEKKRQAAFLKEAQQQLAKVSPYVIGITGSYGKTSTKDALGRILQTSLGPTFWPVKGINTEMGNTREIRTRLKEGHRYAVMEMGAYQKGSIQKLCALTPPDAAIITAVGTVHLERFGSAENVLLAKAELAEAVPQNGVLVCNGDDAGARKISEIHRKKTTLLYGFDNSNKDLACWISEMETKNNGTDFTFHWKGNSYTGFTSLLGRAAISNLAAAFTLAATLGAQPELILAAIRNLEPVDNRLQLVKDGPVSYLRDAYNSNPVGFATALEVMTALPAKRRILMTPGMIEQGELQHAENVRLGRMAAKHCNNVIIVGTTNRKALLQGFTEANFDQNMISIVDTRHAAFETLNKLKQDGDLILIENDLPDLFECRLRL